MGKVSLVKTDKGIKEALIESLNHIGGIEKFINHTDIVMLKPNLNGTEGVTNIELVEALIQILLEYGVKKIIIAESTFGNEQMTDMCFNKTGYSELAKRYDLQLKNLKGLLVREEKRRFHEVGLDKCIVDLNNSIKPSLNIVDCTTCMEKMGPHDGEILNINLLIAGADCAEVDYIGSKVMDYSLEEVKHLKYYIEMNKIDLTKIDIIGEKIVDVKYSFKKVEMENLIPSEFNVYNKNACSSCMNALLMSCKFLGDAKIKESDIYLGSGHLNLSSDERLKIAFGNCCLKEMESDRVVKGCPPFPFLLRKVFEENA